MAKQEHQRHRVLVENLLAYGDIRLACSKAGYTLKSFRKHIRDDSEPVVKLLDEWRDSIAAWAQYVDDDLVRYHLFQILVDTKQPAGPRVAAARLLLGVDEQPADDGKFVEVLAALKGKDE